MNYKFILAPIKYASQAKCFIKDINASFWCKKHQGLRCRLPNGQGHVFGSGIENNQFSRNSAGIKAMVPFIHHLNKASPFLQVFCMPPSCTTVSSPSNIYPALIAGCLCIGNETFGAIVNLITAICGALCRYGGKGAPVQSSPLRISKSITTPGWSSSA